VTEHLDLWRQIEIQYSLRFSPIKVTWVKGHISQAQVDEGLSSQVDKDGNDAADRAAVHGSSVHACPDSVIKAFHDNSKHMIQVALVYVQIACARNQRAKQLKVLTYSTCSQITQASRDAGSHRSHGFTEYFVHSTDSPKVLPNHKKLPAFSRKLRFRFGELAWDALSWYLRELRWPKADSSLGVTWLKLALDFELSTGLILPRGHPSAKKDSEANC
jgi:hypothetical protein